MTSGLSKVLQLFLWWSKKAKMFKKRLFWLDGNEWKKFNHPICCQERYCICGWKKMHLMIVPFDIWPFHVYLPGQNIWVFHILGFTPVLLYNSSTSLLLPDFEILTASQHELFHLYSIFHRIAICWILYSWEEI